MRQPNSFRFMNQHLPLHARVETRNGRPTLLLNEQATAPIIYALTDVPGGRWSWEELPHHNIQQFASQGVRLFQLDLALDHVWREDASLDVSIAQKQVRGVLDACAQAAVFFRLHARPPRWWMARNPDENTAYFDCEPEPNLERGMFRLIEEDARAPLRTSLASRKWHQEVGPIVGRFCREFAQTPQGDALAGIQVAGGVYGEWHYWGFNSHEPDASAPMQAHFTAWLREKYQDDNGLQSAWNKADATIEGALVPDVARRIRTRDGVFRDPQQEQDVIDYYRCQHEVVVDSIIFWSRTVKENWPRPIVTSAFYGYFFSTFGRDQAGGHLEVQRVLNSEWVDGLCAPAAYYPDAFSVGQAYRSRGLLESCRLHGKLWLDEIDQINSITSPFDPGYQASVDETIARVRRNTLFSFTKGMGFWFYDFGPSGFHDFKFPRIPTMGSQGWWDAPKVLDDIGRVRELLDARREDGYQSEADVLCVFDTQSLYHMASVAGSDPVSHALNNWLPLGFYNSGGVFDALHLDDLERVDWGRYRVVVFCNTFRMTQAQRSFVVEKVARDGRHIVWNYAPAYSDGERNDLEFMREATGFDLQKIEIEGAAQIVSTSGFAPDLKWGASGETLSPLFCVQSDTNQGDVEALAHFENTSHIAVARREDENHTAWYVALPSYDPALGKALMQHLPAHRYNTTGDIFYAGGGLLVVHSAEGGTREITLRDNRTITLEMPLGAATYVLDSKTGEVLLGS